MENVDSGLSLTARNVFSSNRPYSSVLNFWSWIGAVPIYRAIAPSKQVYKPTEWNSCRIELSGIHLKVTLNGETIQDVDLTRFNQPVKRHDEAPATGCIGGHTL